MRRKKKTTIVTFESRERMTIHHSERRFIAWCEWCGAEVLMIPPGEAAALSQTETRAIFRGIEAGTIHFVESQDSGLLVCQNSVATAAQDGRATRPAF